MSGSWFGLVIGFFHISEPTNNNGGMREWIYDPYIILLSTIYIMSLYTVLSRIYIIVVFRIEFNWMPEISTTPAVAVDTSLLHNTAPGPVLHTVHS